MQESKVVPWLRRAALIGLSAAALVCVACKTTGRIWDQELPTSPGPPQLPEKRLPAIKNIIVQNALAFDSLSAECDVVIASPRINRQPPSISMSGEISFKKPKKVSLRLYGGGKIYIRLVGDGKKFRVQMPIFGNLEYDGTYGEPIHTRPDRLSFLPDDVADAFDLNDVFAGKTQILRTYTRPPEWHVDSVILSQFPDSALRIVNSIVIDRTLEQPTSLYKFNADGSVRVRIWFANPRLVLGPEEEEVQVPGRIWMWYPGEGTVIGIDLSDIEVNTSIDDAAFRVR